MAEINNLKRNVIQLNNGHYCVEYTFVGGMGQKFYNAAHELYQKKQEYQMEDGTVLAYVEDYANNVLQHRVTTIIDTAKQKSIIEAFFDEAGFCTDIYNRTKEKNTMVEYRYDLRGYQDKEGKFFDYAPAEKIINKGLPIEKRCKYIYNQDDTVTEVWTNSLGETISPD